MKHEMMKPLSLVRVTLVTLFLATISCTGYNIDELPTSSNATNMGAMIAPPSFKWTTTQTVMVNITGSKSLSPIKSTLTISGSKGSFYKGLHANTENKDLRLILPTNEKTVTFQFNSKVLSVDIIGGKAVISFDNLAKAPQKAASSLTFRSSQEILVNDRDSDGVADPEDEYPDDPYRAYNNSYPASNSHGTLAFEDNWPSKGDYDFNDVVIDYNINTVTNAQNQVVEIIGQFALKASGASYNNGFGFQLDNISPDKITSVSGANYATGTYLSLANNGLESGQTYANCIVFDDFFHIMPRINGSDGVNTLKSNSFALAQTVTVTLTFLNKGVAPSGGTLLLSDLPASAYNFYLIANKNREVEIHLPDRVPTSLANRSYLGKDDDDSVGSSRFYRTRNNLPWAINIVQGFDYPVERAPLNEAYLHLIRWAETSGAEYPDWYDNKAGYRALPNIY